MSDALQVAAEILLVERVEQVAELGGSRRSVVRRVRAGTETFIVKEYLQPEEMTWSREAAGLKAAAGFRAPRLVGISEDPAVVVMSDLGSGGNLADALLGTAPDYGARGVLSWAEAIGELQAYTADRLDVFREALAEGVRVDSTVAELEDASEAIGEICAEADLPWDESVRSLFAEALEPLLEESGLALTPGDPCPDNNLISADGLTLLDFEFAEIRHRAWEAAYLRVPWPSCWCAWQVPDGLSTIALDAYVGAAFGVHGPPQTFERDVDLATLLWCIDTCTWYLRAALEPSKPHNTDDDRIPGRRTLVLSRLDLATRLPGPEPLVGWVGALRTELVARWGEHPLRLAPAFR